MNCQESHDLIRVYIENGLSAKQQAQLETHLETCQDCREAFRDLQVLPEDVCQALRPLTSAPQARQTIMAAIHRLAETPAERRPAHRWRWPSAAAAVLVLGLGLGYFAHGWMSIASAPPTGARTTIQIADLHGLVLIRHAGQEQWSQCATRKAQLFVGDELLTGHGATLALVLEDDSRVLLESNGGLTLTRQNGGTVLSLAYGALTAELQTSHSPFYVDTPQGRVHALGTTFTVTVK